MKRKGLAIGIILLFVGTCIIPAIAQDAEKPLPSSKGNWLYVGGSGPGNYTRIQDAIDNASDGDTVFVYDDSSPYRENLIIDKSLSLIGENRDTTIIRGNGQSDIIILNTENSIIYGLTIEDVFIWKNIQVNGDSNRIIGNKFIEGYGIDFYEKGQNSIVENNLFFNPHSIYIYNTTGIIIRNNTMDNSEWSIKVRESTWCIVENNSMVGAGLEVLEVGGQSNKIINNIIRWNESYYNSHHTGINLEEGNQYILRDNHLIECGIRLASRPAGEISNNFVNGKPFVYIHNEQGTIVDNAGQVLLSDCDDITVRNLTISKVGYGISFFNVSNSLFELNTISDCIYGIFGFSDSSKYVNNTIASCETGLNIFSGNSNSIIKNRFINCSIYGCDFNGIQDVQNNSFTHCNVGIYLSRGFCSHNLIENCSIGIQCSGIGRMRVTYNSIQFCSTGIFVGDYGFKSLKVTDTSTTMILPLLWHFRREISLNNILNNSVDASFANAFFVHWIGNYWGEPFVKPKIIHGYLIFDPYGSPRMKWINIDWHPAQEPYDIPGMR